jgi:acetyl esterase/lipase
MMARRPGLLRRGMTVGAFFGMTMLSLLSGCSPAGVLNAVAPRVGITTTRDVAYAPGERHALDIYAPAERPAPVIVFIYGGSWQDGSRSMYRFVGAALARCGFVTVIPDYRLYPPVRFPGFLQDAALAVAWTRANIARYGGDPRQIVLMGHSAGAQMVAMLTLDPQWLHAVGLDPDRDIAAMVGLAGPYDFLPLTDPVLQTIFAPAGDLRLTQPITFARGDAPPMFLAAGRSDRTVLPRNTERLAAAIRADGGQVEEKLYPGIGHAALIGAVAWPLRWLAPVLRDVTAFLKAHGIPAPRHTVGAAHAAALVLAPAARSGANG